MSWCSSGYIHAIYKRLGIFSLAQNSFNANQDDASFFFKYTFFRRNYDALTTQKNIDWTIKPLQRASSCLNTIWQLRASMIPLTLETRASATTTIIKKNGMEGKSTETVKSARSSCISSYGCRIPFGVEVDARASTNDKWMAQEEEKTQRVINYYVPRQPNPENIKNAMQSSFFFSTHFFLFVRSHSFCHWLSAPMEVHRINFRSFVHRFAHIIFNWKSISCEISLLLFKWLSPNIDDIFLRRERQMPTCHQSAMKNSAVSGIQWESSAIWRRQAERKKKK